MTEPNLVFAKGQTFSFLMKIPDSVEAGFFKGYLPKAQLRKYKSNQSNGLIANLNCFWADPKTTKMLTLYDNATENWPVGLAELDVLFQSAEGSLIRSTTVTVQIVRGITQ
uniref:L-shaped tail-fiber protein n=1 Tax=Erwinia phage Fifi051 TaxID=3238787 RepID=A0AB39ACL0_9CAUD